MPSQALAHAAVVRLDPPAGAVGGRPTEVRITFSEQVTPVGRGVEVVTPGGRRFRSSASAEANVLILRLGEAEGREEGTYRVLWRIVAQDTHPSRGTYTFSVDHPSQVASGDAASADIGSVSPLGLLLQALARWLHFIAYALSFGVLAFQFLVLRDPVPDARLRGLIRAGIALLIVAEPIALIGQAASLGDLDSAALASVLASNFGRVLALRLGAAFALWGLIGALEEARWRGAALVIGVGAGLAFVDGLGAHTIPGLAHALAQVLTGVHVAAMGVWVGGLAALLAVSRPAPGAGAHARRFSPVALAATITLIFSGALLALAHMRQPADFAYTSYGLTLALKVVAVGVALAAALFGVRAARSGRPELMALVGVLALTGLLASLPPPR